MQDIRTVKDMNGLIGYFSENLGWNIDLDDFEDIEDISYDFSAADIGLKEEAFAKIASMRQLQPMTVDQQWGIFCIEFESSKFEVSAMRKILSGLIPRRRASVDHAVWQQQDLLFICNWGEGNNRTIGLAHFEDREKGLPQIKMISCAPALEDFTQIKHFEDNLSLLAWPKDTSDIEAWRTEWSNAFSVGYREVIQTSSALTIRLAAEAQNIRNRILDTLAVERSNGYVHLLCEKFRNTLIHDMTEQAFADMYAQTVVYGLFSARCMDPTQNDFSVNEAVECIPNTNPFLKNLMRDCLGAEVTGRMQFDELDVGNVVDLLAHTNTDAIIKDFNRQTGGGREDPVIHFYEEFLTAYDKAQKVQRGVFYTPQPVVNFIVRAVDDILKTEFGLPEGLASTATKQIKVQRKSKKKNANGYYTLIEDTETVPAVQVLDPATGTGTFLRQVILQIYENFRQQHQGESETAIHDAWNAYVPKHLLPRINGFELMMAPYAVAHMKLAMVLKDTGYDFGSESRLNVCLTNTLEAPGNSDDQMSFFDEDPLAMESIEANKVKKNNGVSVLIGNPPYSGESVNKGEWIMNLMEDYKKEPGGIQKLQERNPKWINDDYVKFIRYAQEHINNSEEGILAYICPHGFLDNPTFRGMRWYLLQKFSKIYILNLHGNTKRKEIALDGSKDENVFDIMQGVCIIIAIKKKGIKASADVVVSDCFGLRETKYTFLTESHISDVNYQVVELIAPQNYFVNKDYSLKDEYEKGFSITELFAQQSAGMVTARDTLTLHSSRSEAEKVIDDFMRIPEEEARMKYNLGNDVQDWKVVWAQQDLQESCIDGMLDPQKFTKVCYRCFDSRISYYTGKSRGFYCRPRFDVMQYMLYKDNIGLVTVNRQPQQNPVGYFLMADAPISNGYIRSDSVSIDTIFPLFVYIREFGKTKRIPNFNSKVCSQILSSIQLRLCECESYSHDEFCSPYDVMDYIYSILYSLSYRNKFAEYLKIDYPRIPFPQSKQLFWKLVNLGQRMRNIHLFTDLDVLNRLSSKFTFSGYGSFVVEKSVGSAFSEGRIYINKNQFFNNISEDTWTQYIGGYQPLQKWLKDRKGQTLTQTDIEHYQQMIAAIEETQRIMQEIDTIIEL